MKKVVCWSLFALCAFTVPIYSEFSIHSSDFRDGEMIPQEYGFRGKNFSPELSWKEAPSATKSFAIVVSDPDAPSKEFIHWIIYNIPASKRALPRNIKHEKELEDKILQGINDFQNIGYDGPAPPLKEKHSYIFTIYALDIMLPNSPGVSYRELKEMMEGHILAKSEYVGFFENDGKEDGSNFPLRTKS